MLREGPLILNRCGRFGPALKQAGFDAIFFSGTSEEPAYILVENVETQLGDYYLSMGWDPDTGVPKRAVFERLGLNFALEVTEQE